MAGAKKKKIFIVNVSIENKPFLNDPEGETVLNDLILKENYSDIVSVRSAQIPVSQNTIRERERSIVQSKENV